MEPEVPVSPALAGRFLTAEQAGKPQTPKAPFKCKALNGRVACQAGSQGEQMSPLGIRYGRCGLLCPQHYTQRGIPHSEKKFDQWMAGNKK